MRTAVLLLLLPLLGGAARGGEPFRNLNFEQTDPSAVIFHHEGGFGGPSPTPLFQGFGASEKVLPGWTLFRGGRQLERIGFNMDTVLAFSDGGGATIVASPRDPLAGLPPPFLPFEGNYSLRLLETQGERFTLRQTGEIPADAQFLTFTFNSLPFTVRVNGEQLLPVVPGSIFEPQNVALDISRFAGQNVELSFDTAGSSGFDEAYGSHNIDNIRFVVPEPNTILIISLGGILALFAMRKRRGSSGK